MVEEIAPEGESCPQTNALITSDLITGAESWANTQAVDAKTARTNMHARFIVFRSSHQGHREIGVPQRDSPAHTAGCQLSKVTGYSAAWAFSWDVPADDFVARLVLERAEQPIINDTCFPTLLMPLSPSVLIRGVTRRRVLYEAK
jgi:hypothetical protein